MSKKNTKILITVILLFSFNYYSGQGLKNLQPKIFDTGKKIKNFHHIKQFSELKEGVFIYTKYDFGKQTRTLKKYDHDLNFLSELIIKLDSKRERFIDLCQVDKELIVVYYKFDKKSNSNLIYAKKINLENLTLGKRIMLSKEEFTSERYYNKPLINSSNKKLIILSDLKSRGRKNSGKNIISVFNSNLELLWKSEIKEKIKPYFFPSLVIDNNNDVYFLSQENKNHYELYSLKENGTKTNSIKINKINSRLYDFMLTIENNKILIFGIVKKITNNSEVIFIHYKFDENLKILSFSYKELLDEVFFKGEKEINRNLKKRKNNVSNYGHFLGIKNIFIRNDGGIYLVSEHNSENGLVYQNAGQTVKTSSYSFSKSIIVSSINSKGEIISSSSIYKNQSFHFNNGQYSGDNIPILSFGSFLKNDNLYLVYNQKDNNKGAKKKFIKASVLEISSINPRGEIKNQIIFNNNDMKIMPSPRYSFINKAGDFVFIISTKKDTKFGVIYL